MKKLSLLLFLFLCLFVCNSTAQAIPWSYKFTSRFFGQNDIHDNDSMPGQYTTSMRVEMTFITNDGALPDGNSHLNSLISSWSATDGRQNYPRAHTVLENDEVTVIGGLVKEWNIDAWDYGPEGEAIGHIHTNLYIPPFPTYGSTGMTYGSFGGDAVVMDQTSGSWQAGPTPEPTTMLLLGSGLVGLAVIRRKRFRK